MKLELAWRNVTGASWDVLLGVASNLRRPVAVVARSGAAPELTSPIDMGLSSTNFPQGGRFDVTIRTSRQPTTADRYTFDVFYDDGLDPATETVSGNLITAIP